MGPRVHPTPGHAAGPGVAAALAEAAFAVGALDRADVDAGALLAAGDRVAEPNRIVVFGRVSAGKSRLVGRLSGTDQPTGVGGVTRTEREVPSDGVVWVDTPGIDDPDHAVIGLGPTLERADGAVWVTDGLQPMTSSEREVAAAVVPDGLPVWVVVSKLDLVDPDEHGAVIDRVRVLAAPFAPRDVRGLDLRAGPIEASDGIGRLWNPGPKRAGAVRALVGRVRAQVVAVPPPLRPQEVAAAWRDGVRRIVREVDAAIDAREVQSAGAALTRLTAGARALVDAVGADDGPQMPMPSPPPDEAPMPWAGAALLRSLDALSGAERARRALRQEAARWLAEGELALAEGWPGASARQAAADRRARAMAALNAVDLALARAADRPAITRGG